MRPHEKSGSTTLEWSGRELELDVAVAKRKWLISAGPTVRGMETSALTPGGTPARLLTGGENRPPFPRTLKTADFHVWN